MSAEVSESAARAIALARRLGVSLATAESVTGGLVAAALTSVPGASDVFLGGIVAYGTGVKRAMLGVAESTLDEFGPVSAEVAIAMASGACGATGADAAVATTGVAGPAPHGGRQPGTVWIAAVGPGGTVVRSHDIAGDRREVRAEAAERALRALCDVLDESKVPGTRVG